MPTVIPPSGTAAGLRHGLSSFRESSRHRLSSRHHLSRKNIYVNNNANRHSVEYQEKCARDKADKNFIVIALFDVIAALKVFCFYLISPEALCTAALSIGLTVYWYNDLKTNDWKSGDLDRMLLTFAVISPMSASIAMAFNRRERALQELAKFRSFTFQIYLVHSTWDWKRKNGGRAAAIDKDWMKHSDTAMSLLVGMGDELCRFLSLPTSSRSRHRFTHRGRKEAVRSLEAAYRLFDSLCTQRMTRLGLLSEELKTEGLSETETSRCHQYERWVCEALENLRLLKSYRTPEALRTFARLFILVLPALYAPSFAETAINLGSLGFGITFAAVTTIGLRALFESIEILEDPFVGYVLLDGIDVEEELMVLHWQQLVNAREVAYPEARQSFPPSIKEALSAPLHDYRKADDTDLDQFLEKFEVSNLEDETDHVVDKEGHPEKATTALETSV